MVKEGTMKGSEDHPAALTRRPAPITREAPRWLALGAVAGPALFTLAWFVLGFQSPGYTLWDMRIEPYSAISQPISGLGLGETAPYMNAAFVLNGLLIIAGVIGIFSRIPDMGIVARRTCAGLLALNGLGSISLPVSSPSRRRSSISWASYWR